jgi:MFS family permease
MPKFEPGPKLNRRPLSALFVADAISLTGNAVAQLAIPWYVLITTGSPVLTGLAVFFNFLPAVLAGLFGGVIVDRLGFRRTSVIADIASAAAVAAIPLLDSTVGIELWQLMALVFLGALLDAPGATARAAILPDLATAASVPMERASGIRGSVQKGSQLIGGPLGGLLVAALGAPTALWVNAVSFLFSAALVAWAVPPTPGRRQEATSFRTDLVEGWRFVRQHRLILAIVLTVLITNFLDAPFSVAMPVLANEAYGGAAELGLMYGTDGGMALLGSLLFSAYGHRLPRRPILLGGYLAVPALYLVLASLPPLPAALITLALVGFATGGLNPVIYTVAYEKVPPALRGRVFGTMRAGAWAAIPAGVLLGGVVVQALGVVTTFLIIGLCYLAVVLYGFFNPAFRQLEKPSEPVEQPGIPDPF